MFNLRCLSLFSNIGVAEAYFEEIDIDVCIANEIDEHRAEIYRSIYPNTEVLQGDIVDPSIRRHIVDTSKKKKVNFVIATPPCQGMSIAGNKDPLDPRNHLIFYAIDVIKRLQPCFVLIENVPRQMQTKIFLGDKLTPIPSFIKNALGQHYFFNADAELFNTADFGVPQNRKRSIFLAIRKDVGISWPLPDKENEVINLEESIGALPPLDPLLREGIELTTAKFPDYEKKRIAGLNASRWHIPPVHPWRQVEWMTHTPTGASAIFNSKHYPIKRDGSPIKAHHNHYRRLAWDKPSRTVDTYNAYLSTLSSAHPGRIIISAANGKTTYSDARALSILELLIVMSLPKDWPIPSDVNIPLLRTSLGEGIPPLLTKKLLQKLQESLQNPQQCVLPL